MVHAGTAILALIGFVSSCSPRESSVAARLHTLLDEYWQWRLTENPEFATYLGDDRYNDRLTDMSLQAIEERHRRRQQYLEKLAALDSSRLSKTDRLNYQLFNLELAQSVQAHPYRDFLMPVNQMGGPQIDLPNLMRVTPFRHARDYDAYLARLGGIPDYLAQTMDLMERGLEEGRIYPAVVLKTVPDQIKDQFDLDPEESPFYEPFTRMPAGMSDSLKEDYRRQGIDVLESAVFPAFRKLHTFCVETYLPRARKEIAATTLPEGRDYYKFLVAYHTTTALTPDQIHAIGLGEVGRIRAQMEKIIEEVGFDGTFEEFLAFLRTDSQFYYTREEDLLDAYRVICKRADPELVNLFGTLPRTPYGIIPIPDYQAPASPTAYYYPPAADGSRPGYFWANTYRLDMRPKYEMEALALHEAVPGHHLQIALAMELEELPEFRKHTGFTAFTEGWGLYAESLGEEMGFYQDPYSKFGQLTYEMWRACRLVVDTGMHALGWSRQRAIDFMKENTAKTEHDISVEIDRYITWPGQALAYKVGELKIRELRAVAKRTLGDRFDPREFHDVILGSGSVPLSLLEQQVRTWLAEKTP
ncbi:MAG: DUF885 family protein [Fidelibacterota bacterium]